MGWTENDADDGECRSDSASDSVQTKGTRKTEPPPSPHHHRASDLPSRLQRRHNYVHVRLRIREKISIFSDMDVAIYLFLRKLNNAERDFLVDVKTYLTKDFD